VVGVVDVWEEAGVVDGRVGAVVVGREEARVPRLAPVRQIWEAAAAGRT
jgi:hypothetical protein